MRQINNLATIQIYTDGSKVEGKVGAAFSAWENGSEIKVEKHKLSEYCSVYQAELYALLRASTYAEKQNSRDIAIISDSRSSLETLRNVRARHPLAIRTRETLKRIQDSGKRLQLYWVKAHVGVAGNERADELAKEAAFKKTRPSYDACPTSYIKRALREKSVNIWQERYNNAETAGTTKIFFPNVKTAYKTIREIAPSHLLCQAFTGHGAFAQYLHRFKLKDSPDCACNTNSDETIIHLLTDCNKYRLERMNLECKIKNKIVQSRLEEIIADSKIRYAFLEFTIKIVLDMIERNKTIT